MTVTILCVVCVLLLLWVYILKIENRALHEISGSDKNAGGMELGGKSSYRAKGTRSYSIGKS